MTNPAVTEIKPTTTKTSTDSTGTGPISIPTLREILRAIRNGNISQRDEAERWWNVLLDMRREKRRRFSIRRTIKIKLVEKLLRSYEQKHEDENSQD